MSTQETNSFDIAELKKELLDVLDMQKAEDVHSIDLHGTGFPADHMIIASGQSGRHVVGLANKILDKLSSLDIKDVKKEGLSAGDWVILDTGDIIVHLFRPEVRLFYNIEKMWDGEQSTLTTIA